MLVADSIRPVKDSRENSVSSIRLPGSLVVLDENTESDGGEQSHRKIATASLLNKSMTYKKPHEQSSNKDIELVLPALDKTQNMKMYTSSINTNMGRNSSKSQLDGLGTKVLTQLGMDQTSEHLMTQFTKQDDQDRFRQSITSPDKFKSPFLKGDSEPVSPQLDNTST